MYPYSLLPESWPVEVHLYGVMIAIGVLFAFGILFYYSKKKGIEENFTDFIFYNGIVSIGLGFLSAALFQATYNYIENPEAGFQFGSGITFIGGLIGGVVVFLAGYFLFRRRYKTRLYQMVSAIPCSILIAHGFGRIGCFFAGCCHGKETDFFLGVKFPHLPNPVHPTQLYEAAFLFIMFGICFWLVMKKNFKHNLSVYLISYGIFRFFNEYLRGDDRGELVSIVSPSQFWSILMVVAGILVIFLMNYILKREAKKLAAAEVAQVDQPEEVSEETTEE